MADFPDATFAPRTISNVSDAVYTPTKTTQIYAEDFHALRDEIIAIETVLGLNPNGAFDTVKAWLLSLGTGGGSGGTRKFNQLPTETPDGTIVDFTLPDIPSGNLEVFLNGSKQTPATDYTLAGAVVTFAAAPVGDKPLFDYDLTPGGAGGSYERVYNQLPIETPDGVQTIFTLPDVVAGNLVVSLNGERQTPTADYINAGATVTFSVAPVGEQPIFDYDRAV